jgi:prepilin-type N-terminal cleavage/methylation domain-containing protein/prepilin-type processing-associated H-X9-DG protein
MNRPAFTLIEFLVVLTILVVLLSCLGFGLPIDLGFNLVFGWALYLARVVPQVRPDWGAIATGGLCLVGFGWGLHRLLTWIYEETRAADGEEEAPPRRWRRRWTASLVALIVLMFVAGISTVGVAHQVGWLLTSKEPLLGNSFNGIVRRLQSANNLKSMGIGVSIYCQEFRSFPPGGTFDGSGRPLHGWQTALLPFVEQVNLYDQVNLSVPWDDPRNKVPFSTELNVYRNPGIRSGPPDVGGYPVSHYAGNARVLGARALAEIADGTSNTILAGEVPAGFRPWGYPVNWRDAALGINRSPSGFGGPFPGGANVLFADGSVRFLKDRIDMGVLKALSTPDGGEQVSSDAY